VGKILILGKPIFTEVAFSLILNRISTSLIHTYPSSPLVPISYCFLSLCQTLLFPFSVNDFSLNLFDCCLLFFFGEVFLLPMISQWFLTRLCINLFHSFWFVFVSVFAEMMWAFLSSLFAFLRTKQIHPFRSMVVPLNRRFFDSHFSLIDISPHCQVWLLTLLHCYFTILKISSDIF
jgi:hypothetical protein